MLTQSPSNFRTGESSAVQPVELQQSVRAQSGSHGPTAALRRGTFAVRPGSEVAGTHTRSRGRSRQLLVPVPGHRRSHHRTATHPGRGSGSFLSIG